MTAKALVKSDATSATMCNREHRASQACKGHILRRIDGAVVGTTLALAMLGSRATEAFLRATRGPASGVPERKITNRGIHFVSQIYTTRSSCVPTNPVDHGHHTANKDPESVDPPVIYFPILLCVQQARGLPFRVASGPPVLRAAPPVLPRERRTVDAAGAARASGVLLPEA